MKTPRFLAIGLMVLLISGITTSFGAAVSGPDTIVEPIPVNAPEEHSSADAPVIRRDPFWPVGYVPPTPGDLELAASGTEDEIPEIPWPALPVRGRSRAPDGTFRVLIDGIGIIGVNRVVSIPHRGFWFHWRIVHIDDKGVRSKRLGISKTRTSSLIPPVQTAPRKEKTP